MRLCIRMSSYTSLSLFLSLCLVANSTRPAERIAAQVKEKASAPVHNACVHFRAVCARALHGVMHANSPDPVRSGMCGMCKVQFIFGVAGCLDCSKSARTHRDQRPETTGP